MSLINQPIFKDGIFFKPLSNKYVIPTGLGGAFNNTMPMGGANISSDIFSYNGQKITVLKTSRYRISFSFISQGSIVYGAGGFAQFSLIAGSQAIGIFTGQQSGGLIDDNFGRSEFYSYPNANNTSTTIGASGGLVWLGLLSKTVEVNLVSGNEIYFNIQGVNLLGSNHFGSMDGYLIVEEVS